MKRSESTLDRSEPQAETETLEPQAIQNDPRRESNQMRQWLEARNAKVGSNWAGGSWAERRTRRTLH